MQVYRVLGTSEAQSRLDIVSPRGLTPMVGREAALLHERWAQARDGLGQVVVLSGEAGIGKSRLVMALKEYVAGEPHTRWECRCSPYFQDSALYPLIDRSQRALRLAGTSRLRQSSRSSRWRWRAMASPSPTPWGSGLRSYLYRWPIRIRP